jgi:hypothetical protein
VNIFIIILFALMWVGVTYSYLRTGCIGPKPGAPAVCGTPGLAAFCILSLFFIISIFFLIRSEIKKKRGPR